MYAGMGYAGGPYAGQHTEPHTPAAVDDPIPDRDDDTTEESD